MTAFPPIVLPADWSAAEDCEALFSRSRPEPTFEEAIREEMRQGYQRLLRLLDLVWARFEVPEALPASADGLSQLAGKVARVERLVRQRARGAGAARLLAALQVCAYVESERERVVSEYCLGGEASWMYPLLEANDYLARAAVLLAQATVR